MNSTIYNRATMSVALNAQEAEALRKYVAETMGAYVAHLADTRRIEDDLRRQKVHADYNYRECATHGNADGAKKNLENRDNIGWQLKNAGEEAERTWRAECAARELMKILEPLAAEARRERERRGDGE